MSDFDQSLPKQYRIKLDRDFEAVFKQGRSVQDQWLIVTARRTQVGFCRLGCFVSKRLGNAVFRNHCKRMIREAFRLRRPAWPCSLDLAVRPKTSAALSLEATQRSLDRLVSVLDRKLPALPDDDVAS